MKDSLVMIQTTTSDQQTAAKIASGLLETRKAACVQIQTIESHYHWANTIASQKEFLIIVKTAKHATSEAIALIKNLHNYSLPEIIQINISETTPEYQAWVVKETKNQIPH